MIGRQHAVAKEAHIAGSGCYGLILFPRGEGSEGAFHFIYMQLLPLVK